MRKSALLFFILLLLSYTYLCAQGYKGKGKVMGYVYDEKGNPIEGVRIKLFSQRAQSGFVTTTDAKGRWKAFYVRGGSWKIEFEKVGYIPKKISAHIQEFSRNTNIEITLKKMEGLAIAGELKEEIRKGNDLFDEGKYEAAIKVYEAIIEKMPDIYVLYKNIGNCYFQMEKYEEAEESYLKVLDKESDNHEIMLSIGNTYANRNLSKKAQEWYNKIDFEKIDDPLVLFNVGSIFYTQSKYEEALKYFKKAVEIKNDFLDALYQLALVHLTLGNNQESIHVFNEYLKHDSDSERAAKVKGFIEFLKKK